MFAKIIVISMILSLSGCVAISESDNCDPKLNYVKSNIPAMKEYSKLKKERVFILNIKDQLYAVKMIV